eukprot:Skav218893  [mRNA]  locus=scaffold328:180710:185357:+ [translate_table: standard]
MAKTASAQVETELQVDLKDPKGAQVDLKLAQLEKCMIQIGERFTAAFVDEADVQAMKEGHVLPMNRSAHNHFVKKTHKSLVELVEDPSALKRAIKMRRMELEEVANYRAATSLNAVPDEDKFKSESVPEPKRKPRMEML